MTLSDKCEITACSLSADVYMLWRNGKLTQYCNACRYVMGLIHPDTASHVSKSEYEVRRIMQS